MHWKPKNMLHKIGAGKNIPIFFSRDCNGGVPLPECIFKLFLLLIHTL